MVPQRTTLSMLWAVGFAAAKKYLPEKITEVTFQAKGGREKKRPLLSGPNGPKFVALRLFLMPEATTAYRASPRSTQAERCEKNQHPLYPLGGKGKEEVDGGDASAETPNERGQTEAGKTFFISPWRKEGFCSESEKVTYCSLLFQYTSACCGMSKLVRKRTWNSSWEGGALLSLRQLLLIPSSWRDHI